MPAPALGLDFGTTNSSVALASAARDGSTQPRVELLSFADGSPLFRSLLYLEQHRAGARTTANAFTGPAAIERYLARHTAEIERPGRLIQSLKSYLSVRTLTGTEVFGRRYMVEELISRILGDLRSAASAHVGSEVTRAVVGRPVHFVSAETPEDNAFALSRLTESLRSAGFTEVCFLPEPVAAAYAYGATLTRDELVLIGDFGGGTSDFSLIRVGPGTGRLAAADRILGTSGVGLAGDALDARLVRHLVAPALGAAATVNSFGKPLPLVPAWIYANLERWHTLSFLRTRNVEQILAAARLRAIASSASATRELHALTTLVDEDLGYTLHQAVQRTKVELSSSGTAGFTFRESGLALSTTVSRAEFEAWIAPEVAAIAHAIDALLRASNTAPERVDRVFLTGGTSLVPAIRRLFDTRFDPERIVAGDAFTSVAHGLALHALEKKM